MAKKKIQETRTKLEDINDSLSGIEQKFEQHKKVIYWIVAAILIIIDAVNKHHRIQVYRYSSKIPQIEKLNQQFSFYEIHPVIPMYKQCSTKNEFDRIDLGNYLTAEIAENQRYFHDLIQRVEYNRKEYAGYCPRYYSIMRNETSEDSMNYEKFSFFRKKESEVCDSLMLKPVIDLCLRIEKTYISPKGRNRYSNYLDFHYDDIVRHYEAAKRRAFYRESAKYQRDLMTDSLRYDILKRDGFRCVICGATAQDGVKLHVDHILPVSKGGKTEPSNLRTLCDRCNMGKRAKYDPYGVN